MKTFKIEWSKYFYKRMKLYILCFMFGFPSFISPIVIPRLLLAFISVGFGLLGLSYGRYWKIES